MTTHRFVFAAIALAVCQMVAAQSPPLDTKDPTIWSGSPATPAAAASAPAVDADNKEPHIYRGDDRMVAPPKPVGGVEGASSTFNFEEAPVAEVVRAILGDMLKVDYVLHPPLQGTVTLSTRAAVSPDQAIFLLESALLANGLALSRDARGSYHVGKPDTLKGIGSAIRQVSSGVLPPGTGSIIVPLRYIGATEMAAILKPLVPGDAILRVDTVRNLLILAGNRTQAEGWLDIVSTFDVNLLKGMSVGVFPLKYASVKDVEMALRLMTPGGGGGEAAPAAATPAAGRGNATAQSAAQSSGNLAENSPFLGALRIMPIERINSIMVVTPRAAYLDEARQWIERLDKPSDGGSEPQLYVYPVQNGNARHLSEVLNGIFGNGASSGSTSTSTGVAPGLSQLAGTTGGFGSGGSGFGTGSFGTGGFGAGGFGTGGLGAGGFGTGSGGFGNNAFANRNASNVGATRTSGAVGTAGTTAAANGGAPNGVRVIADEVNNSILVYGSRGEYGKIEAALRKLDIAPAQVLIEASIIEVSLKDDLEYGLQWFFSDKTRGSKTAAGSVGGTSTLASIPAIRDVSKSAIPGFAYSLTDAASNIRATLNALADKSLLKVISSPSVMVMDNYQATISVGDQVPIRTGETIYTGSTSPNVTTTIQYKDTGVQLGVLPSVNAGDIITMDINQNVSNATGSSTQPVIQQRQIASKVAVRSGETLVLGGLIRDNVSQGRAGVPYLQDIPIIGAAFGSTTITKDRTELVVIITPRVIRNSIDLKEVGLEMRDRLRGLGTVGPQDLPAAAARLLNEPAPAPSLKPNN